MKVVYGRCWYFNWRMTLHRYHDNAGFRPVFLHILHHYWIPQKQRVNVLHTCISFIIFLINFHYLIFYLIFDYNPTDHVHIMGCHMTVTPMWHHPLSLVPWCSHTISFPIHIFYCFPQSRTTQSSLQPGRLCQWHHYCTIPYSSYCFTFIPMIKYHMGAFSISYHHMVLSHTHLSLIIIGG
jgi:hypothetical protein